MKKELVNELNAYLANVAIMNVKLHNLHWNVYGSSFKQTHEYLESLYDSFQEELDVIAEILKMEGEMPLATFKDYMNVATIKEIESKDYEVQEALKIVLNDYELLLNQLTKIHNLADENFIVINHVEDTISEYKKTMWFIKSMLK